MTSDFGSDIFDPGASPAPKDRAPSESSAPAPSEPAEKRPAVSDEAPTDGGEERASASDGGAPSGADSSADAPTTGEGEKRSRRPRKRRRSSGSDSQEDSPATATDADERDSGTEPDQESETRSRRGSRRRRGRDDRGRDDRNRGERGEREDRGGRGRERGGRRSGNRSREDRGAETPPTRQRVAILVDATELEVQAKEQNTEISFGHLRRTIAGTRIPIRAMAYHGPRQTRLQTHLGQGGFETVTTGTKATPFVAMAVDAMAVAERVDCIVLVPGSAQLNPLATTLRARGVRVESAGFAAEGDPKLEVQSHLVLGSESGFKV